MVGFEGLCRLNGAAFSQSSLRQTWHFAFCFGAGIKDLELPNLEFKTLDRRRAKRLPRSSSYALRFPIHICEGKCFFEPYNQRQKNGMKMQNIYFFPAVAEEQQPLLDEAIRKAQNAGR